MNWTEALTIGSHPAFPFQCDMGPIHQVAIWIHFKSNHISYSYIIQGVGIVIVITCHHMSSYALFQ